MKEIECSVLSRLFFVVLAVIFCKGTIKSQDFPIGTWSTGGPEGDAVQYTKIEDVGFNWIVGGAHEINQNYITDFDVLAQNGLPEEWIYYYSNGKYTKWDAERDEFFFLESGFKHPHNWSSYLYGQVEEYLGATCWATYNSNPFPVDSILWGPNYTQEKKYKLLYNTNPIRYTVRYRLALTNTPQPADTVCKLYVRYRCKRVENGQVTDTIEINFDSLYLTAADLPGDTFHVKSLSFDYPEEFREHSIPRGYYPSMVSYYDDDDIYTGIEYCIKWYGNGKLYVDYVEVFDDDNLPLSEGIWRQWLDDPQFVSSRIETYLSNYSTGWENIKYWYVKDEPHSVDCYEPYRIIDSLVYAIANKRVMTQFYPAWNGRRNGDYTIKKFVELAKPEQVYFYSFPFSPNYNTEASFNYLKPILEQGAEYAPDFWYGPQGFGFFEITIPPFQGEQCHWRYPDSSELKASIFFALAYGSKGIQVYKFASNGLHGNVPQCSYTIEEKCLAGYPSQNYPLFELGQMMKDNIVPRLKGKLGNKLLLMKYTGNNINVKYQEGPPPEDYEHDFLSIQHYGMSYFWHAGFLVDSLYPDNKHFLLTNLRTSFPVEAKLIVSNNTDYQNVSFTDIEGGAGRVDTTIKYNSSITYYETMPEGEGRLYRVAPVVLYGGRLIYNETVPNGTTLHDEMIIENGAALTISGDYYANADIIVKNGSIVTTGNGKIKFQGGHKLIIEGTAAVNGTPANKLTLDFVTPVYWFSGKWNFGLIK